MDRNTSRMTAKAMFRMFVFISVVLLLGCSEKTPPSEGGSSATGSIALNIILEDSPPGSGGTAATRAMSDECGTATQYDIFEVRATVYSSPNSVTRSWDCSAHNGTLEGVPPGNNLRLVIIGYNASAFGSITLYSGETRVNVVAGQTATPTIVTELFAADKISPGQDALGIDPDSITFSWRPVSGADEYVVELYDRADASDPGRVVIFSETVPNTSYTYNGGLANDTTYYWGVFPLDIAGHRAYDYGFWAFTTVAGGADVTSPTVIANTPTGTDVPVYSDIMVTFSEPMDVSTFTNLTYVVNDGSTDVSGTIEISGATARFTPTVILDPGVTYTVMVAGSFPLGVTDLAGNFLASDFSWSFTTTSSSPTGLIWDQDNWDATNWN